MARSAESMLPDANSEDIDDVVKLATSLAATGWNSYQAVAFVAREIAPNRGLRFVGPP